MTISLLVLVSLGLSLIGMVLFGSMLVSAWQRHRRRPSTRSTWELVAVMALLVAMCTLFVTALGAAGVQSGWGGEWRDFVQHLAMMLRGSLIAFALALWYGWRTMPENGG